jgi:CheY-like chemotaxis protein
MTAAEPIRVMVVDDHEDMRFILGVILGDHADLRVVAEAAGGQEALAVFDEAAPDVVIVDARMPIMDGYELTRALLERRPGLPIALITAAVDEEVEARGREAGVREVASKEHAEALPDVVRRLAASDQPGA